jgi:hypothetical protein
MIDKRLYISGKIGGESFGRAARIRKSGAHLFSIPVAASGPDAKMDMNDPSSLILFDNTGVCDGEPVISCVRSLISYVRAVVDDNFARFF